MSAWFRSAFGVDLRTLAVFRAGLALAVLIDLVSRAADLRAHYTDFGVLPRQFLRELGAGAALSLHQWGGESTMLPAALFLLHALAAVAMLLGYRTRLATIVVWFLLISLQRRNIQVLHAGDLVLRLMLFWSMFLPLGARFALDSRRSASQSRGGSNLHVSVASFAVLIQVCSIYWFAALLKLRSPYWEDGMGMYYALNIDQQVGTLGLAVREMTGLLPWLSRLTIVVELLGPCLPFIPGFRVAGRLLFVAIFAGLHLAFALCLSLGTFVVMSIAALLVFLPGELWDRLMPRSAAAARVVDGPPPAPRSPRRWLSRGAAGVCAVLIACVLLINVASLDDRLSAVILPRPLVRAANALYINQSWYMFTREMEVDGWFVIAGRLAGGREVDLLRGGRDVDWTRPRLFAETTPNRRWAAYLMRIGEPVAQRSRWQALGRYLCRSWNERHEGDERLEALEVTFMAERTEPWYVTEPQPMKIVSWRCEAERDAP